jgi:hypothetical protein
MTKFGFSGLNSSQNSSLNTLSTNVGLNKEYADNLIIVGRVIDIILDNNHDQFSKQGEWRSIGTIEIVDTKIQSSNNEPGSSLIFAKPLFSNIKQYPLKGEIVVILSLPSQEIMSGKPKSQLYYLNSINIWNSQHHNAVPFFTQTDNINNQNKNYNVTSLGSTNKDTPSVQSFNLGTGVIERGNLHPLWSFPGDYIIEGRWSNSIRLGSTYKSSLNSWSNDGENGNPITIISNGQPKDAAPEGYIPISEDINKDLSSIYLTSNQKIPINPTQFLTKSYINNIPDKPNQYIESQVILNANRILINSNKDHILLNSFLTIGFNSSKGFNFDTPTNFIVAAPVIKLGDKDTTNPMLRGNETVAALNTVCDQLIKISTALSTLAELIPTAPQAAVNIAASEAMAALTQLKGEINVPGNLKSKTNFLI